jgi:hypothetical protein
MAHRDLASRIHVRNAPKADKPEPTRMTPSGHAAFKFAVMRNALSVVACSLRPQGGEQMSGREFITCLRGGERSPIIAGDGDVDAAKDKAN